MIDTPNLPTRNYFLVVDTVNTSFKCIFRYHLEGMTSSNFQALIISYIYGKEYLVEVWLPMTLWEDPIL